MAALVQGTMSPLSQREPPALLRLLAMRKAERKRLTGMKFLGNFLNPSCRGKSSLPASSSPQTWWLAASFLSLKRGGDGKTHTEELEKKPKTPIKLWISFFEAAILNLAPRHGLGTSVLFKTKSPNQIVPGMQSHAEKHSERVGIKNKK